MPNPTTAAKRARALLELHQPGNRVVLPTVWDAWSVRRTEAASAGADVFYSVGRHDPETLRRLATELLLPINAIALPNQDDPASLVRRR